MLDHYVRKTDPSSSDGGGSCGDDDYNDASTQQSKLATLYSMTSLLTYIE